LLSVDAVHEILKEESVSLLTTRPLGIVGACLSSKVFPVMVAEVDLLFIKSLAMAGRRHIVGRMLSIRWSEFIFLGGVFL
jgi:hypothetical protein